MLLKTLVGLLLTAAASASQHQQHHNAKRTDASSAPTAASTFDSAKVSSRLQVLLGGITVSALVPSPTVTLGVSIPADLSIEIMTAVPMDVLVRLMNPTLRPATHPAGISPELKTFFETIAKDIKTGSAVFTVSSTPTVTGTAEATEDPVSSSSSSGLAAQIRAHNDSAEQLQGRITQGKWLWGHRPEEYATENFAQAADHLITGAPFQNRNVPPGYVHESWNLAGQIAQEKAGIVIDLTKNGDWSVI